MRFCCLHLEGMLPYVLQRVVCCMFYLEYIYNELYVAFFILNVCTSCMNVCTSCMLHVLSWMYVRFVICMLVFWMSEHMLHVLFWMSEHMLHVSILNVWAYVACFILNVWAYVACFILNVWAYVACFILNVWTSHLLHVRILYLVCRHRVL